VLNYNSITHRLDECTVLTWPLDRKELDFGQASDHEPKERKA
jgi:hypothetical protein